MKKLIVAVIVTLHVVTGLDLAPTWAQEPNASKGEMAATDRSTRRDPCVDLKSDKKKPADKKSAVPAPTRKGGETARP